MPAIHIIFCPSYTYPGEESLYLSITVSDPEAFSLNVSYTQHTQNNTKSYEVQVSGTLVILAFHM